MPRIAAADTTHAITRPASVTDATILANFVKRLRIQPYFMRKDVSWDVHGFDVVNAAVLAGWNKLRDGTLTLARTKV